EPGARDRDHRARRHRGDGRGKGVVGAGGSSCTGRRGQERGRGQRDDESDDDACDPSSRAFCAVHFPPPAVLAKWWRAPDGVSNTPLPPPPRSVVVSDLSRGIWCHVATTASITASNASPMS